MMTSRLSRPASQLILSLLAALLLGVALLSIPVSPSLSQPVLPTSPPGALLGSQYVRSSRLGITFISSAQDPASPDRYRNALLLGAGWNRWPLYWHAVEQGSGAFNWDAYDRVVTDDLSNGLQINAILLGMPDFHRDGERPAGLYAPIFSDGTDIPGAGKSINPQNYWARFVFSAVQRYKPGGTLSISRGWPSNVGVRVWEVWNEPDFEQFWGGSIADYARLLKVAYLAAHSADAEAQVMFGGLLYATNTNWLEQVLRIYSQDPLALAHNWFMDMVAIHSYSYPARTFWLVNWTEQTLKAFGLSRPVWVNESGVSVWDDYPGPVWASSPEQHTLQATTEQAAWYVIQNTVLGWAAGADVVFIHQLYDDCGNQPAGTDFPPHQGELCTGGALCFGDAFGLFRNPPDAACFSQHPFAGTPRPTATAYRLLARVFGNVPFGNPQTDIIDGVAQLVTFDRPQTNERIYILWNRTFSPVSVAVRAGGSRASLYTLDDEVTITPDSEGFYKLDLAPAKPDSIPNLEAGDVSGIGGAPVLLIERFNGPLTPLDEEATPPAQAATPDMVLTVTPGPIVPPRPTVDPALDSLPPVTSMAPLPATSPAVFDVLWHATDDSGIDRYLVWVRVDGGNWQPWLETQRTQAQYSGEVGHTYEFAVWAVDLAGNWSTNTDLQPQAMTRVEQ